MNELDFFDTYCNHLNNQDIEDLGDCFSGPVIFFLPDGNNHIFSHRDDLDENTTKVFELYNEFGFYKADFKLLSIVKLADCQQLCQLKWTLINKYSRTIISFETSYILSGKDKTYTITAVFVQDELEKMNELRVSKLDRLSA